MREDPHVYGLEGATSDGLLLGGLVRCLDVRLALGDPCDAVVLLDLLLEVSFALGGEDGEGQCAVVVYRLLVLEVVRGPQRGGREGVWKIGDEKM